MNQIELELLIDTAYQRMCEIRDEYEATEKYYLSLANQLDRASGELSKLIALRKGLGFNA